MTTDNEALIERLRHYDAEDEAHNAYPPAGLIAEAAAALEASDAKIMAVMQHVPMAYLRRHDQPGATGPTKALNLEAAMRDYAADRHKAIDRIRQLSAALEASDAALAAASDGALAAAEAERDAARDALAEQLEAQYQRIASARREGAEAMREAAAQAAYQWWDDDDAQDLRAHIRALPLPDAPAPAAPAEVREEMKDLAEWLDDLHRADLNQDAADGGVTVGMVYQKEAAWRAMRLRRNLARLDAAAAPRWRHKKRGTTYTEIGRARLQIDGPADMTDVVIYRADADGSVWVRPVAEMEDGRFARLDAAAGGEGGHD